MGNDQEKPIKGYRILSVDPGSPFSGITIHPMLDFIVYPLTTTAEIPGEFEQYVAANENKEIELTLYNIVARNKRNIKVMPKKWQGSGLLGVNIRFEDYAFAHTRVLRVLNFYVDSPLHKAGFKQKTDYILGTDKFSFDNLEDFGVYIREQNKKKVQVHVYNSADSSVRKLEVIPDDQWGGVGVLGGDIAYGELHYIPQKDIINTKETIVTENIIVKEEKKVPAAKEEKTGTIVTESEILIGKVQEVKKIN
jgi:hypothetical protein